MSINEPFPNIPSRSTSWYLSAFDPAAFNVDKEKGSNLYHFVNALVGTGAGGAGTLINQIFMTNLSAAIDTCCHNELDYIVGNINFLARTTAESYSFDPSVDMLTSDQWDEVRVKDAWFRARIKDFFAACQLGGTPEGIRKCVSAAIAADCTIQEVYRYSENFMWEDPDHLTLGRTEAQTTTNISTLHDHYSATNLKTGYQVMFSGSGSLASAISFKNAQSPSEDWEVERVVPRNEVVIRPHKQSLNPSELRLIREMLNRLLPVETVITVDTEGLSISVPVSIAGAAADSTYYEVVKQVEPGPIVDQLPAPEFLSVDLLPSEQWLLNDPPTYAPRWKPNHVYAEKDVVKHLNKYFFCVTGGTSAHFKGPNSKTSAPFNDGTVVWVKHDEAKKNRPTGQFSSFLQSITGKENKKREAPYGAFMQTSQYSYYYLAGTGMSSPIDSVTYGTLRPDGSVRGEANYQIYQDRSSYTGWMQYEKADSPDNFPGGKFGRHPAIKPAINTDGTPYSFPYSSQSTYVAEMIAKIQAMGGIADTVHYRLPINKKQTVVYTYYPDYAVSNYPPSKESTISSSITKQRPRTLGSNLGNPTIFTR